MNDENRAIVSAALNAKTAEEAFGTQEMIEMAIGEQYFRPLGDRRGNFGLLASGADYDLKLVELITNMQDAIIERGALARYGSQSAAARVLSTPREAVAVLFTATGPDVPEVTFWESDPPATKSHKLTVWFDDRGVGMTPAAIPETIFALGGSNKEDAPYLQGAFGLGGELMYRNSDYVVLVTRRAPELLNDGEEDRIAVAIVQWNDQTKTQTAAYLVDRDWLRPGDIALPWSCPASDFPDFLPGTHIGLISYGTAALYRQREGDERSFDTIVNTRLYRPMFNTRWRNYLARGEARATNLRGLRARVETTSYSFPMEDDLLPFVYQGQQYFLGASYVVFAERGSPGERRSFVAHDHAVLFTSNGQVQTHWTPAEFKAKTKLKKLDGRVLVEVNLDALPVEARTSLVTPDRAGTVKSDVTRRLDDAVIDFLNDWDPLVEQNRMILQEQLRATTQVSTRGISEQIRRAFSARGFASVAGGSGTSGAGGENRSGGGGGTRRPKEIELHDDPTLIEGPHSIQLELGRTRGQRFTVDATDGFFLHGRGELRVESGRGFPFVNVSDIVTVGRPHAGRVRLSFAIPDGYDETSFELTLAMRNWARLAGGMGPDIEHTFTVSLVEQIAGTGTGDGRKPTGSTDSGGSGRGANAVVLWVNGADRDWQPTYVGELDRVPAADVASLRSEFADLSSLGSHEIDCITLNSDYHPLVRYLTGRAETLTQASIDLTRNRYAVGVGVEMLVFADEEQKLDKQGRQLGDEARSAASRAAARGVLAVLPEFDRLAQLADDVNADV